MIGRTLLNFQLNSVRKQIHEEDTFISNAVSPIWLVYPAYGLCLLFPTAVTCLHGEEKKANYTSYNTWVICVSGIYIGVGEILEASL